MSETAHYEAIGQLVESACLELALDPETPRQINVKGMRVLILVDSDAFRRQLQDAVLSSIYASASAAGSGVIEVDTPSGPILVAIPKGAPT